MLTNIKNVTSLTELTGNEIVIVVDEATGEVQKISSEIFLANSKLKLGWKIFDSDDADDCMKVLFVKDGQFVISGNSEEWDTDTMTPIGIVVVPEIHDMYEDGSIGVMSLVNMSHQTPEKGDIDDEQGSGTMLVWGSSNHGLDQYNGYPMCGTCAGPVYGYVTGYQSSNVFLPSDIWLNGIDCPTDNTTKYYLSTDASRGWVPSPYNGKLANPLYIQGDSNPLSLFNGKTETAKLLAKSTKQTGWETDAIITNSYDDGYYPAACCCARFHTEYTEAGDWYLPAEGELGYVVPRFKKINETVDTLNAKYGKDGKKVATKINMDTVQNYFSCTPSSTTAINRISTMNGTVGTRSYNQEGSVRAFMKVTLSSNYLRTLHS